MSVECSVDRRTYPWCRVCLMSNLRMCTIASIQLQEVYEKLTSTQIYDNHGVPQEICFICYSQLRRAHRFSQMAHRSQMILEDMRLQGREAHQIDIMPNYGIGLKLSATDISTISLPDYSTNENVCDPEVVCAVLHNTLFKQESVCDVIVKLEENYFTPEENEGNDNERDETIISDSLLLPKYEEPTSVTDDAIMLNEVVHEMEASKSDPEVKSVELQNTIYLKQEVNEVYDSYRDPTHTLPYDEAIISNSLLLPKYEEPTSVKDDAMMQNEVVHDMKASTSGMNTKLPLQYECKICNKAFTGEFRLKLHIRTHTGEKPYRCEICYKSFAQKYILNVHRRIHTGEKLHKCEICNNEFLHKRNLQLHIRIHTGEKPFKCEICNKAFTQQYKVKLHIRTHTGEKPHECEICNKAFSRKESLLNHIRIHTGE